MPIIRHQLKRQKVILREKVIKVVEATNKLLTGREIAVRARLEYKQTIDALDALYNTGRVQRYGKKMLTKWGKVDPAEQSSSLEVVALSIAFDEIYRARSNTTDEG